MVKKILTILLIIIVALGLFGLWFLITNKPIPFIESLSNGDGTGILGFGRPSSQPNKSPKPEKPITIVDTSPITEVPPEIPRLQRLTTNAISGSDFTYIERPVDVEEVTIPFDLIDFIGYPTLRLGDEGDSVTNLQAVLAYKNGFGDEFITGTFDEDTDSAVKDFQTESSLGADGIVGGKTYLALNRYQGLIEKPLTEIVPLVRYVEKRSGNIFDVDLDTLISLQKTNTLIPRTYESFFMDDSKSVVLRYAKDNETVVESFSGSIIPSDIETAPGKIEGTFLPQNISFLTISPDKKSIFYIAPNTEGVAGVISNIDYTSRRPIFSSPFSEWIPDWTNKDIITLQARASGRADGYIYGLNTKNGALSKLIGNKKGLTGTMNPDGALVVYSETQSNNKPSLFLRTISSGKDIDLGTQTLSEKCIWDSADVRLLYCAIPKSIPSGLYPDYWYQGRVSFDDEIWRLDGESGIYSQVVDPNEFDAHLDIVNMTLEKDKKFLIFTDKITGQLWMYRL